MFNVVLVSPQIPPNTGNVMRLCANTGCTLHLVEPLGFPLDDAKLRRAGLDYREYANVRVHADWTALLDSQKPAAERIFVFTTHGTPRQAPVRFLANDWFVFGSETSGLAPSLRDSFPEAQRLRLPMRPASRSLNLSNAVAVVVFEAWRQNDFQGGA